ncbi:MAG: electron transfer flavoprotein subunit beta/FixA family protein [Actinomycetia bacterium]|nr:electron transfer flavoprotein subunit beta/FixA family protein [Actinomycetes bacterium]
MKIVVCVKQVPDSWAEKKLNPTDNTLDRDAADAVVNELDEYAIEEALQIRERLGGADACTVTVLTVGPEKAIESVRKGLQMGADDGVHVIDDAIHGSDAVATSAVLASAIERLAPDLVLMGSESTDARMSVVPAMLAERTGRPQLTFAGKVELDAASSPGTVRIQRVTDYGYDVVEAQLPAVVSVVEKINEPRYPSFKGIMAAKKKPVETLSLTDLGVEAAAVGLTGSWSSVQDFAARPPRAAGTVVTDAGDGGTKVADFLSAQKFI